MLRDVPGLNGGDDGTESFSMNNHTSTFSAALDDENDSTSRAATAFDDVFGSASPSPTLSGRGLSADDVPSSRTTAITSLALEHPSDLPRLQREHITAGYREGLAVAKERFLQEGFDAGYELGIEIGLRAGWCLGALEGLSLPTAAGKTQRIIDLLDLATAELHLQKLFGEEFFSPEGHRLWDISSGENNGESGVALLAAAHPLVMKWVTAIEILEHQGCLRFAG